MADRDRIERGFTKLTPEQRAVLVLQHYTGLSLAEIVPPSQATEAPSASPSAPSPSPLTSPTSAGPTSVELVDGNGLTATIQIVDCSGLLVAAAGFPAVLGSRPCTADAIGVDHQLVLMFSEPIRATDLVVALIRLP